MARLTRKNIKVFAGNATNNGVFGSLQANNPTTTSDVEQIQSLSAWGEGWNAATQTAEKLPPLEEFQGVQYVLSYQQAYIMQEGVPEWSAEVTYYKGGMIKEITNDGFILYASKADNNKGYLPNNTSYWSVVFNSADPYAFDSDVVHITGDEAVSGVKDFTDSPLVLLPESDSNDSTAANTQWVTSKIDNLDITGRITSIMNSIYPVGSFYFCTQDTCPLSAIISGSTWEKVGSSLITSVNTNVPVKGNGKTTTWSDGSSSFSIMTYNGKADPFYTNTTNVNLGTGASYNDRNQQRPIGLSTDSSKSGIVGTVTRTALTVNIFKRTA